METELVEIFGVTQRPSAQTADAIYDTIDAAIKDPAFRPRALLDRFGIEVIGTTDPAWADIADHRRLASDGFGERILPTFRPDPVVTLDNPTFAHDVLATGVAAGVEVTDYRTYLDALRAQRLRFKAAGARATDHACLQPDTTALPDDEAARLFDAAFHGRPVTAAYATQTEPPVHG